MNGPHRLFVAIDLDEAARAAVSRVMRHLAHALASGPGRRGVRWVAADQLHLTLAFMAAVADADLPAIRQAMGQPLATAAFEAEFRDVGLFPPAGPPRVVWIGIGEGDASVHAVSREVRDRLAALGVPPESRPFTAHLTLGRWRESRVADRTTVTAAAPHGSVARVRVDRVTLYESHLSPDGPSHVVVTQAALGLSPDRGKQP
ncbi:MAG: RNA 2',3'-cyclic phosphodiesterase [Acidobacteriota bacterium]|nr:RNA 2',3'-cyclic phosphodiesterase [Acidobacteriota bacterium]